MGSRRKPDLKAIAAKVFGFADLRPGQGEAIQSVLDGHDSLVVMPTGAGKSAIYQAAALLLPGPTVVVSPLIALQKDQVDALQGDEFGGAAALNSLAKTADLREALEDVEEGDIEFIFLAPEQFGNPERLETLRQAGPSLFVVDEAHCISEWGHDFRPDYLRLGSVIEALGHPRVLALTATAAPAVRDEIVERLQMRSPRVIVRGFDRPNIRLEVRQCRDEAAKLEALQELVEEAEKPGIVYAATRKHAQELATALSDRGIHAVFYHGGMNAREREAIQDAFMSGEAEVIAATSAFGMGIDKPDVRFVFHYDISDSLDSYYQEIGRAGRDGLSARAVLLYRPADLNLQKFFKGGGKLSAEELEHVAEAVHREGVADPDDLREQLDLSRPKLAKAVNRLEEVGVVEKLPTGEIAASENGNTLEAAARDAARQQEERRDAELLRLEKMRAYAEMLDCRREYLLNYFGEETSGACGNCDNCSKPREAAGEPVPAGPPFPIKSRVLHRELGKGLVESYEPGKIVVLFDEGGRKTLSLDAVIGNGLLEKG